MSKVKEQLAAALLNHVHVVEQSLVYGLQKRRPVSKRYSQIPSLDFNDAAAVNEVLKSFIAFNAKHFIGNLRHVVDKLAEKYPGITVSWAPKILVRGLSGRLVVKDLQFMQATSLLSSLSFSRQTPEISAALEMAGSVTPVDTTSSALDILIPAFKNAPFSNLQREEVDFLKILDAKILVLRALTLITSGITAEQTTEVTNGRSNILVSVTSEEDGRLTPTSFSLEETDSARASRIARERLEEVRRRRTMGINSVTLTENQLTYDVSPLIAPDEHQQISVNTNTLIGW